jgi:hypothetical protein
MNDLCREFIRNGSEFFVAYASAPPLPRASLFLVGHAVELHLKAAYVDRYGGNTSREKLINKLTKKYSHNIKKLWDYLKTDPNFMPSFNVREDLYGKNYMDPATMSTLKPEDIAHLSEYSELYMIMGHLQDLKYLFLPWNPGSYGFSHPGPFWISLFKELRAYLRYPEAGQVDHIEVLTRTANPSQNVVTYLDTLRA